MTFSTCQLTSRYIHPTYLWDFSCKEEDDLFLLYACFCLQNKCNVGYAFINMVSPSHIIPFYKV